MNTTDGGCHGSPLSLKQGRPVLPSFKTEKIREFRRTPEFFIYFFEKAAIYDRKITANYSI